MKQKKLKTGYSKANQLSCIYTYFSKPNSRDSWRKCYTSFKTPA